MPRLENEIAEKIKTWEATNGRLFLVCGDSLTNFIKSHWENFNRNRDMEKQMRVCALFAFLKNTLYHLTIFCVDNLNLKNFLSLEKIIA